MASSGHDLIVVGGGSGGVGAALAAARLGLRVLLLEAADQLGGTSTRGGVNCWEPGAGGTGIPFDLYRRLRQRPGAVGIYRMGRHCCYHRPELEPYPFPGGEALIDPAREYRHTLRRHGLGGLMGHEARAREELHGVIFEPQALAEVMTEALAETARCEVRYGAALRQVECREGQVLALELTTGESLSAACFVDATGDAVLCAAAGCEQWLGQDPQDRFGEPEAPPEATAELNGVSLLYRLTPTPTPAVEPLPAGVPGDCWWAPQFPVAVYNQYPGGDLSVNMLPAMSGREHRELGTPAAYAECRRRILAHWRHVQQEYAEFRGFRVAGVAPMLGVREGPRTAGEYVLTTHDLRAGLSGQTHPDIIALADHALDTHGQTTGRAGCGELHEPYGIPYRCLLPRGMTNLLVACRGASFSSLAASSCRLSRTMMQLGQAAGTAAGLALGEGVALPEVNPAALRAALRRQHVAVDWPLPAELRRHLGLD